MGNLPKHRVTLERPFFSCGIDYASLVLIKCKKVNENSVREIADILQRPKSNVSDVIVKWKHRGSETAEKRTGRPKILGERSRRTLERVVKQTRKSSLVDISQEFQSSSGISVSSRTVRRELKILGFHGHAAAHKPNITPQNAKQRLQLV
ncbi:regulator of chromosome condensation 2 [Trichonephila clavipes]|nr:regulator of chromosome condensation 2 [Trichonephila clavipes]